VKSVLKYILFFLFLSGWAVNYGQFADSKYYLVDSLVLENLSSGDKELLESELDNYHKAKSDTGKLKALSNISNEMYDESWESYNWFSYNMAKDILESTEITNSLVKNTIQTRFADAVNNLGYIYNVGGNSEKGMYYYKQALKEYEKAEDKSGMALASNNIAFIYDSKGDFSRAIGYYEESLTISESLNDQDGIASSLNNVGYGHLRQEHYELALKYFRDVYRIREELNDDKGIAYACNNIGFTLHQMENNEEALFYYWKGYHIKDSLNDLPGLISPIINIASMYKVEAEELLIAGDNAKATILIDSTLSMLGTAMEIAKEKNRVKSIITIQASIADAYFISKDYGKAKSYGEMSYAGAVKLDMPDELIDATNILYSIYKETNQFEKALLMFEIYKEQQERIKNDEVNRDVMQREYSHEFDKKRAADSLSQLEKERVMEAEFAAEKIVRDIKEESAAKQRLGLIGLAIGIGIIALVMYSRFRTTRKQKGIIEEQKKQVDNAFVELEEKNTEILDSINYAKRIQKAILPPNVVMQENLKNSFVLYKPKDIVAGDFYWLEHKNGNVLFAAADCTGHGVPGAMVSVICNNGLNRSVREHGLVEPGEILDKTREIVVQEFEKSEEVVKDGMDIALCSLDSKGEELKYAGAHNPLWIIRDGEVLETKADKQPIGKFDNPTPYTTHTFKLQKEDAIYIFSDGFVDQFGGERGKKFKSKAFKELLLSVQGQTMELQRDVINDAFENWKGSLEQLDDVCVIGVKV